MDAIKCGFQIMVIVIKLKTTPETTGRECLKVIVDMSGSKMSFKNVISE